MSTIILGSESMEDYEFKKTRECAEMLKNIKNGVKRMRKEEKEKQKEKKQKLEEVKKFSGKNLLKEVSAKKIRSKEKANKNPLSQLKGGGRAPETEGENEELKKEWMKPFMATEVKPVMATVAPVPESALAIPIMAREVVWPQSPCWCLCHNSYFNPSLTPTSPSYSPTSPSYSVISEHE